MNVFEESCFAILDRNHLIHVREEAVLNSHYLCLDFTGTHLVKVV